MNKATLEQHILRWVQKRRELAPALTDKAIVFFQKAFANTRCADRAWFGLHSKVASLVVGNIWLASLNFSSADRGLWLLVDQNPPRINGIEYFPVRSTQDSIFPLVWAHSYSFDVLPDLVNSESIWSSYAEASEKILHSHRVSADRDARQQRFGKYRLSEIEFKVSESSIFPDEVNEHEVLLEGAVRQVIVNAYERNPVARKKCIEHFGLSCQACGFNFEKEYGEVGRNIIHVHHKRPLSEIGVEYEVDPIEDLIPVCPNCHTVIHLREPAYTIEEVKMMFQKAKLA